MFNLNYNELYGFVNKHPASVILTNFEGKIEYVNIEFTEITEYSINEVLGKNLSILISDQSSLEGYNQIWNTITRDQQWHGERRCRKKNGNVFWAIISIFPIHYDNGNITNFIVLIIDITKRKTTEEVLKISEARNREIVEFAPNGILILSQGRNIIKANRQMLSLTARTLDNLVGKNIEELFSEDDLLKTPLQDDLVNSGLIICNERHILRPDGTKIPVEMQTKMMPNGTFQSTFYDITERKLAEERLRMNEAYLRKAEKIAKFGNWSINLKDGIVRASEGAKFIYGVDEDELTHDYTRSITLPEYLPLLGKAMEDLVEKDISYPIQFKICRPCDSKILDIRAMAEYNKDNNLVFGVLQDVTDIRKAEQKLKVRELFLENLVENIPYMIVVKEAKELKLVRCNKEGEKFLCLPREDILGKTYYDLFSRDEAEIYTANDRMVLENKTGLDIEHEITKSNEKETRILHTKLIPIIDINGYPQYILGISEDITERKIAEENLRRNETYLRNAEKIARFGNLIIDLKDSIVRASEGAKSIYGVVEDELTYDDIKSIALSEYHPLLAKAMNDLIKHDMPYEVQFKIRRKCDNKILDILAIAEYNKENRSVFGVIQDVTDRKKAEAELQKSQSLLINALEMANMGHWEHDLKTNTFTFNDQLYKMLHTSVKEIGSYTMSSAEYFKRFIHPDDVPLVFKLLSNIAGQKDEVNIKELEHRIIYADGNVGNIIVRSGIEKDRNGKIIRTYGVNQDITKRKSIENELVEAKEKAERSVKLKSEFLAQMSHEIRTPINAILSFSGLIMDEVQEYIDDELRTGFSIISRAGKRIIRTIDLLLNMSEIQTGSYEYNPKTIDLYTDVLSPFFHEFREMANNKSLEFRLKKLTDDLIINADDYSLIQIFSNLIDNAIKYTFEGEIVITIFKDNKSRLVVSVEDTGIGIAEEYLPYLFQPFTQEEQGYTRKFEGNGLGLTLVKKYCELNNISIEVESEKGKGSKFTLTFNNKDAQDFYRYEQIKTKVV